MNFTSRAALIALALLPVACAPAHREDGSSDTTSTSSEELTTVPPGPNKVYGIDVSHYQGSINWAAEKAQGRLFGIASVGDGMYQDPTFATNWAGMKAAGVIRGAYQFFEPATDPIAQADILVAKVGRLGDGDLPATIDVEATGGQSPATVAARVGQWLARVEAGTGRKPMIYTGPYFWESNVASSAYVGFPLWVADYGPPAPLLPNPWTQFKMWQYSDSNGTLDLDLFNGSLAELQAFARPPNVPPKGYLDVAACTGIGGWSQDDDVPKQSIAVHVYFDGAAGAQGAQTLALNADQNRQDLCAPLGSCNHGFSLPVPRGLMDDHAHAVYAYGIDEAGGANTLLTNSPKSFTCKPPDPPLAPAQGVKRWIPSPAVLAAWKFSTLLDVAHYDQARIAAFAKGDDLPATPDVVIADDGSPTVWVVDGGKRRHVIDPASMAAWRFGAPKKTPAAQVNAIPQGPDWRAVPFLMQGPSPEVYVLDLAPATPPGSQGGSSLPAPTPGSGSGSSSGGDPVAGVDANGPASSSGCNIADRGAGRAERGWRGGAFFGLALALTTLWARRRPRRPRGLCSSESPSNSRGTP